MKNYLLLPLVLLLAFPLFAQDTTVVQTFTWSSNTRADTFQFPQDPANTWRKIYLVYNMRCHDAAVGGCGEWDYSCNTFLTDPSRIDSTRQTHPDYVISGFSGSSFPYALQPTFTYYQYQQHLTEIAAGTALETTVGNGTDPLLLSLGPASAVAKNQALFTAAELAAGLTAGPIHGLKVDVNQAGQDVPFFRVRLKATAQTALFPDNPDLEGFTEVFFNTVSFDSAGPRTLAFYQPFAWDGVSNLLLEWSVTPGPGTNFPGLLAHDPGFDAVISSNVRDYSLNFGSGSFVTVPPAPLSAISSEITVAFWSFGDAAVYPANSTIFEGFGPDNNREINVHLPWSDGRVYWDCGGNGGNFDRIDKQGQPADWEGRWNHWAFTKNAATGVMSIYLNGALWHTAGGKTNPIDLESLILGASHDQGLSYHGKIDEFQIWDKELDAAAIAGWMRREVTPDHPDYAHLLAYYRFDDGPGTEAWDSSPSAAHAEISLPHWLPARGEDLFKDFALSSLRPNTTFLQGDLTVSDQLLTVLDSVENARNRVVHHGVSGTDLIVLGTSYYFPAGPMDVIDAATGSTVGEIQAPSDGTIEIGSLIYYTKRTARYELLSLVTPYGNGLNLGAAGKTFTFDVTDYAPLLRGEKFLSIEFGGEWQEELDLKFVFVKGTPAKAVLDIQNVWPQGRAWDQEILDDRYFEPRSLQLNPGASHFKLRSSITGHGQNGEFVPRQHYLDLDGGAQDFQYDVWKYCGKNPIYPQGGTWVFDRAGWCPGMATDVHEFRLNAAPGAQITLDYGINATILSDANYLVSNQLVTYADYAHALDASIETIMRPNDRQVEYARINPACNLPLIVVRNTGAMPITAIDFRYEVAGGGVETYTWTGNLPSDTQQEIALPVLSTTFWATSQSVKMFHVEILAVNGQDDGEPANDYASMRFAQAQVFNYTNPVRLKTVTNNTGGDYSYTITDASGNTVMSRLQMLGNTTYTDVIDLPNGCYTLHFEDAGNDGLSFWFFPQNGSGTLNFSRLVGTLLTPVKTFNPDFGGGVQFDFVVGQLVGTEDVGQASRLSVYPNPASDVVVLEMSGFEAGKVDISVSDLNGRVVRSISPEVIGAGELREEISLGGLPAGMYVVRVTDGKGSWGEMVVKE